MTQATNYLKLQRILCIERDLRDLHKIQSTGYRTALLTLKAFPWKFCLKKKKKVKCEHLCNLKHFYFLKDFFTLLKISLEVTAIMEKIYWKFVL